MSVMLSEIFDMCNKVFSVNFDMTNLNSSTFLGNVQWKLAKQIKDSDLKNIFHNSTVTVNLLDIFENAYRKNVFDI